MLMQVNEKIAPNLTPLVHNASAWDALIYFAEQQIKYINEQFHHVDASNIVEVAKLQGRYDVYKQILTLKNDVVNVLRGGK